MKCYGDIMGISWGYPGDIMEWILMENLELTTDIYQTYQVCLKLGDTSHVIITDKRLSG